MSEYTHTIAKLYKMASRLKGEAKGLSQVGEVYSHKKFAAKRKKVRM